MFAERPTGGTMGRTTARLALVFSLAALLWSGSAAAQFDPRKPDDVGLAVLPFEPERPQDDSVAFLLEDYLQAHLPRAVDHPVYTGTQVAQAVPQGAAACLADTGCVRLLGGQFNASLLTHVQMFRTGEEIRLEVAFYTTGNGLLVGRENTGFMTGDEKAMVKAFSGWFQLYFDTSLRVSPESRAGEGGVLGAGSDSSEQAQRKADYERGRTKKVSSRRTDFGESSDESRFDRDDPTSDLRAMVGDDDEPESSGRTSRRDSQYELDEEDVDLDDRPEEDPYADEEDLLDDASREREQRPARDGRSGSTSRDSIALDAGERRGGSVSSYSDAQRAGYGPREYKRYTASGLTLDAYAEHRWDLARRFYLRIGGSYGFGWLTRRYATVVFIRPGQVKTDEYAWERLGPSRFGNPGGGIGIGIAPASMLAIELDVALMYAQQDLRREYDSNDIGTNIPQFPQSRDTAHVLVDVRARFLLPVLGRLKFSPGIGATVIVMQGFNIAPEEPLNYTSRPVAGVFGLTPLVGLVVAATPFLSIAVDVLPTIYLAQGATSYEDHMLFGGETTPRLPDEDMQPPIDGVPFMGRAGVTAMIMF